MICPFCGSTEFDFFEGSESQATAIYCRKCPCGLEDSEKTIEELKRFWKQRFHNQQINADRAECPDCKIYHDQKMYCRTCGKT